MSDGERSTLAEIGKRLGRKGLHGLLHGRSADLARSGLVAIDLGSLVIGGAIHEVGAALSGLDLHFVRRPW
jgi:hypothetical protein